MQNTDKIWTIVDSKQADYIELSDRVFEMPELNYREVKSAAAHAERAAGSLERRPDHPPANQDP